MRSTQAQRLLPMAHNTIQHPPRTFENIHSVLGIRTHENSIYHSCLNPRCCPLTEQSTLQERIQHITSDAGCLVVELSNMMHDKLEVTVSKHNSADHPVNYVAIGASVEVKIHRCVQNLEAQ